MDGNLGFRKIIAGKARNALDGKVDGNFAYETYDCVNCCAASVLWSVGLRKDVLQHCVRDIHPTERASSEQCSKRFQICLFLCACTGKRT